MKWHQRLVCVLLVSLLLSACSAPQSAPAGSRPDAGAVAAPVDISRILQELPEASGARERELAGLLAAHAEKTGTPLVVGETLVFVYQGQPSDQVEAFAAGDVPLRQVGKTGLFVGTRAVPDLQGAALSYSLSVNGKPVRDPWTRLKPVQDGSHVMAFWGPDLQPPAAVEPQPGVPGGRVEVTTLRSERLGESREVWLYQPPGWTESETYPALLVADGQLYFRDGGNLPAILDNLIAAGKIPPVVAVGVASRSEERTDEYVWKRPRFDAHAAFVLEELLPWVKSHGRVSVSQWTTLGFSNGGAWALYMALLHPDLVSGAILQSALTTEPAQPPLPQGKRFYLSAGTLDPAAMQLQAGLHDRLLGAHNMVRAEQGVGGHDLLLARTQLVNGLMWMFPKG